MTLLSQKKTFLFLLLSFLSIYSASAQRKSREYHPVKKTEFGLHAGINIANMQAKQGNMSAMASSIVRLNIGAFVELPLGEGDFSLKTGVDMSGAGMKDEDNVKLTLTYINIPLLFNYNVNQSGFKIYMGPQLGILAAAKGKEANSSTSVDIKEACKDLDVSLVTGFSFQPRETPVVFSAGYEYGFMNVFEDLPGLEGVTVKNRIFSITFGFKF